MFPKMLKFFCKFIFIILTLKISLASSLNLSKFVHHKEFSTLLNFICVVTGKVVKENPDLRTIAFIEFENNFPKDFLTDVSECLPTVSRIVFQKQFLVNKLKGKNWNKKQFRWSSENKFLSNTKIKLHSRWNFIKIPISETNNF